MRKRSCTLISAQQKRCKTLIHVQRRRSFYSRGEQQKIWRVSKLEMTPHLCVIVALQSPIEYQKEKGGGGGGGGSSSLTRNRSSSGNRPTMSSHSRPSSAVGLGDKEAERGRSQMKVSTSNGGSSCFVSRVSSCKQPGHTGGTGLWAHITTHLYVYIHDLHLFLMVSFWDTQLLFITRIVLTLPLTVYCRLQQTGGELGREAHFFPSYCLWVTCP